MSEFSRPLPGSFAGVQAPAAGRPGAGQLPAGIVLALGDIAVTQVVVAVAALAVALVVGFDDLVATWRPDHAAAVTAALLAANWQLGLYETCGRGPVERFRLRVLGGAIMPVAALALIALFDPAPRDALPLLAGAALLAVPATLVCEARLQDALIARGAWGCTAVLVGPEGATARLAAALLARPEIGFRPVERCGDAARLTQPAAEIALVLAARGTPALADLMRLEVRRIIVVPELDALPGLWLQVRTVGDGAGIEVPHRSRSVACQRTKRAFDLCIAVPALLACALPICILALAIKAISPGPAFYVQRRVGLRGQPVPTLKLRTMYPDAEQRLKDLLDGDVVLRTEWERCVKLPHDPRILPILGKVLRRFSLDELPQLWNVVRGEISMVGPRPFPAYHVARFPPEFQALRASVKPGLSGLWQISDRSDADLQRQQEIDSFYIRNWSLWLDAYIVAKTLPALLRARGAR
ncbi:sugar transferase [Falsiroseomonas oryzae]|uniref:sugar transferase n=1 Tax=Falsiroseomonas oryzae TaxID=2766473 RepID=UPI0022EA1B92|nr:sugar transferase [Roseomonas sp. MO-31]